MLVRSFRRLARAAFYVAALAAFALAIMPKPPRGPLDQYGDKVEHIVAFAVLAALANLGFGVQRWRPIVIGLALFGAVIEVVQAVPLLHRDSDPVDWLADVAAVLVVTLAVVAAVAVARRRDEA
jgi:VanZ family protein